MILALFACAPGAAEYREALESGGCAAVSDPALRDDCHAQRGECTQVHGAVARDECGFVRAEKAGEIALCGGAGRFEHDCRMHLWTQEVVKFDKSACAVGRGEPAVASRLVDLGFDADDPAPWSAYYRRCLSVNRPIDRGPCNLVPSAVAREACLRTGLALYDDLLNMARDKHDFPCGAGPMPALLEHAPDREIEALIARRSAACSR
ncbi:MAG: hypothetical protein FJ102_15075 [Deltaproteobacteria bacterium]|nr:hypothetical protein [Deltaproteobacteria bacterium]